MACEGNVHVALHVSEIVCLTAALRKAMIDKGRKRRGTIHKKRWHVLKSPSHLAFRGWNEEAEPWTIPICEEYIEWCHIGKLFPLWRHHYHRHTNKANLKYCENADFVQRCVELWQVFYRTAFVERNEVTLQIARGAYVEVVLKKEVDWTTIKESLYVQRPKVGLIPRGVLKFPEGGLGPIRSDPHNKDTVTPHTDESEEDNDSDGTRAPRVARAKNQAITTVVIHHPSGEGSSSSRGRKRRYPAKV